LSTDSIDDQPIRLPGPAGFASTAKGGGKAGAGLPSPGPAGFASTAKGGGKAGAGLPSPGPGKAGVCSGLILSGAFYPD